jgi:hypothetical protein
MNNNNLIISPFLFFNNFPQGEKKLELASNFMKIIPEKNIFVVIWIQDLD